MNYVEMLKITILILFALSGCCHCVDIERHQKIQDRQIEYLSRGDDLDIWKALIELEKIQKLTDEQ